MRRVFHPGDAVVFRVTKRSTHPGPRASSILPEPHGEEYMYEVTKYWVVVDARADGTVMLQTRRGKQHVVAADNPRLRFAHWWERWLYRHRFPSLQASVPHASHTA